jgi:hypothetical protein
MTITLPHCKNLSTTYDGKKLTFIEVGAGASTTTFAVQSSDLLIDIYNQSAVSTLHNTDVVITFVCSNALGSPRWFANEGSY